MRFTKFFITEEGQLVGISEETSQTLDDGTVHTANYTQMDEWLLSQVLQDEGCKDWKPVTLADLVAQSAAPQDTASTSEGGAEEFTIGAISLYNHKYKRTVEGPHGTSQVTESALYLALYVNHTKWQFALGRWTNGRDNTRLDDMIKAINQIYGDDFVQLCEVDDGKTPVIDWQIDNPIEWQYLPYPMKVLCDVSYSTRKDKDGNEKETKRYWPHTFMPAEDVQHTREFLQNAGYAGIKVETPSFATPNANEHEGVEDIPF